MTDKQHLIDLLAGRHLFLSSLHYTRFVQLYDAIEELPFFCDGLIKCAFIAAWIQNFHDFFLEDIAIAARSGCRDTAVLQEQLVSRIPSLSPGEKAIFEIALEFLKNPGQTPSDGFLLRLSHIWVPIADNALAASEIIDGLEGTKEPVK